MAAPGALTLDTFRGSFKVADLCSRLAEPALEAHAKRTAAARASPQKQQPVPPESVTVLEQLLADFEGAGKELTRLSGQLEERCQSLEQEVADEEEGFQVQVGLLEEGLEETQESFQKLDTQMNHVGQTAARLGDRLHSAEGFRKRALDAMSVIQHLQEFAACTDYAQLSDLFKDNDRLAEAAAMTRQILAIARELTSAKERVGLAEELASPASTTGRAAPPAAPPVGSIEHAVLQLEQYRAVLEHRVVAHFDGAVAGGDLVSMAECARIMSEFQRGETALVQRYISTRPMFMDVKAVTFGGQQRVTDAASAQAALQQVGTLFRGILAAVRDEAVIMEQVFPSPDLALTMFVQRVFEQRVQAHLDTMLTPPPPNASAEALQQFLKLLAEAYRRTVALGDSLAEVVGGASAPAIAELAETVFSEALADYPALELRWLALCWEARAPQLPALAAEAVAEMCAWNHEAVERAVVLSPESSAASNVRQLFHSSTVQRANPGCLLEQVAGHVISGLQQAVDACLRACTTSFTSASAAGGRAALAKAAQAAGEQGVGRVLAALAAATAIIRALQGHYLKAVEPYVADSPPEAAACATGLAALVRAVEDRVLAALHAALDALFVQLDSTLSTEQKKADFRPPEDLAPSLDRPTDACLLATALLRAVIQAAGARMAGANLAALLGDLARRTHALLLTHMQRFSYSPTGALRLKRDVTEYAECVRAGSAAGLDDKFEELQGMVNMLVVAPESLLGLVDGSLRISHQAALRFVRLREDFKTAKVDGNTLSGVFAYD